MTYLEALTYLYSFTDYERAAMNPRTDLKLERMRRVLELAGNPQQHFRSILIAGSKGKGSTAAMLASIAQAAGRKTGFYSSPHLNSHRERMRINGQLISAEEFGRRMDGVKVLVDRYEDTSSDLGSLTTYELGTLIAFQFFADHGVDLAVAEVGLGGRLDATNVLDADLAVIASISYEHTAILGSTLTAIATEKAGIIKAGKPVVIERQKEEAAVVFAGIAAGRGARLVQAIEPIPCDPVTPMVAGSAAGTSVSAGQRFTLPDEPGGQPYELPLLGLHQLSNAGLATDAARLMGFNQAAIREGLGTVRWPGRLEIARREPLIVLDGAHNADSMERLAEAIRRHFRYGRLRLVAGFGSDKDVAGMAPVIDDLADEVVLTRSKHARSGEPAEIARWFRNPGIAPTLAAALHPETPGGDELTVVTGTLYLVGEARLHLGLVSAEDQDPI